MLARRGNTAKTLIMCAAVIPFGLLVSHIFEPDQWEMWALIAAAWWWREIGPLSEKLEGK